MVAKDTIYSSKAKYVGVFSFPDFYDFCYNWIMSEIEPNDFSEKSYSEKIVGDGKNIDITWEFSKKLTDYFKFNGKIKFRTIMMKKVELNQGGRKIKTNQGEISIDVKGILVRDYQNKFEFPDIKEIEEQIQQKLLNFDFPVQPIPNGLNEKQKRS